MNALTLPAARRRNRVVILTGPAVSAGAVNNFAGISRALISQIRRLSPAIAISAALSTAVAGAVAMMWWHAVSITDTLEAQKAIGRDCLLALPLALAALGRLLSTTNKKGGRQ